MNPPDAASAPAPLKRLGAPERPANPHTLRLVLAPAPRRGGDAHVRSPEVEREVDGVLDDIKKMSDALHKSAE